MENLPAYKNLSLQDIQGEEWRDIDDFEGYYQVSNFGRVKSLDRIVTHKITSGSIRKVSGRILKQKDCPVKAQITVRLLCKEINKDFTRPVNRLVAKSFLNISDKNIVCHKDLNYTDNKIENLEIYQSNHYLPFHINKIYKIHKN